MAGCSTTLTERSYQSVGPSLVSLQVKDRWSFFFLAL